MYEFGLVRRMSEESIFVYPFTWIVDIFDKYFSVLIKNIFIDTSWNVLVENFICLTTFEDCTAIKASAMIEWGFVTSREN